MVGTTPPTTYHYENSGYLPVIAASRGVLKMVRGEIIALLSGTPPLQCLPSPVRISGPSRLNLPNPRRLFMCTFSVPRQIPYIILE